MLRRDRLPEHCIGRHGVAPHHAPIGVPQLHRVRQGWCSWVSRKFDDPDSQREVDSLGSWGRYPGLQVTGKPRTKGAKS